MNNAILAIDDDRIAVFRQRGNAGDLAHHRNAHGAGNDHHMAGNGPIFENKSADRSPWIVKQFRCPHGAGHDDGVLRQALAAGNKTGQLPEQAVGEIVEIVQPLAQIGIVMWIMRARVSLCTFSTAASQVSPLRIASSSLRTQPRSWANIR
jgi:hypothetical protein